MFNLSICAAAFLFWTVMATSLIRAELAAVPVRQSHVPTFRSMPIRATALLPMNTGNAVYN